MAGGQSGLHQKDVTIRLAASLWGWCREEALKLGFRGVKPWVEDLVKREKESGGIGDELSGDDGGSKSASMTNRELTEAKQQKIDDWVLGKLEDPESLNSLPKQTQAAIIMARLPKMGVDKGSMEEKALSLRKALEGLGEYEDIQGELVTLREECARLRNECDLLQKTVELTKSDKSIEEKARGFLDLMMAWREYVKDALLGRESAMRCGMLRKDKLVEIWKKGAMEIAGESVGMTLCEEVSKPKETD